MSAASLRSCCVRTAVALTATLAGCGASQAEIDKKAVQRDTSAEALFRTGEAAAELGDMTRAEQYFVASLKAGGNEKKLTQRLLLVCTRDERYPAALEYAEKYRRRHPNDTKMTFASASLYLAVGDTTNARLLLEQVVRVEPDFSDAHYALSTVLRGQGEEMDLADIHDATYLRLSPEGPMAERAKARLARTPP